MENDHTEADDMKKSMAAMQEQMAKMMEMMMSFQKGKGVTEDSPNLEQLQNREGIRHDLQELKVQITFLTRLMEVLIAAEEVQCCKSNSFKSQTCFKQPNGLDAQDSEKNERMIAELKEELHQLKLLIYEVMPSGQSKFHPPNTDSIIQDTGTLASILVPDRFALQGMGKNDAESFKEYAQRWKNVASQVQPPLTNKEELSLFLETLKGPYFDRMIGSTCQNFEDLVRSGELIERALTSGKIEGNPKKGKISREKDVEAQVCHLPNMNCAPFPMRPPCTGLAPSAHPCPTMIRPPSLFRNIQRPTMYAPYPGVQASQSFMVSSIPEKKELLQDYGNGNPGVGTLGESSRNFDPPYPSKQNPLPSSQYPMPQRNQKAPRGKPQIDPIPISYTELLPKLIEAHLVVTSYVEPLQPPYPKWFDANAHCGYHAGLSGHSTENCTAFKHKVQSLIKAKVLNFEKKKVEPNINRNPTSDHSGASVNALEEEKVRSGKEVSSKYGEHEATDSA